MADLTPIDDLPLFPLGTVLFPGGWLPLQIFELRYLEMIPRVFREQRPFAVVSLITGREVQQPGGDEGDSRFATERFHPLGTLAYVRRLERPQPGLLRVLCEGTQRVRLGEPRRAANGLWSAAGQPLPDDPALEVPEDLEPTALSLRAVLTELQGQHAGSVDLPAPAPEVVDDCGWVAHRWAELLPLPAGFKQQLLATDSPLLRLELVADVLDRLRAPGDRAPPPAT